MLNKAAMTELLEQAIAQVKTLPADEQDAIAARLLAEMEAIADPVDCVDSKKPDTLAIKIKCAHGAANGGVNQVSIL